LDQLLDPGARTVPRRILQTVIHVLARTPIDHRPGAFQLSKMAGNTRLTHSENFLELGHGKLFLLEKEKQAQTCGIGNQTEEINR
jgi:hypothetical protein